jgi:hypothetical protein
MRHSFAGQTGALSRRLRKVALQTLQGSEPALAKTGLVVLNGNHGPQITLRPISDYGQIARPDGRRLGVMANTHRRRRPSALFGKHVLDKSPLPFRRTGRPVATVIANFFLM